MDADSLLVLDDSRGDQADGRGMYSWEVAGEPGGELFNQVQHGVSRVGSPKRGGSSAES